MCCSVGGLEIAKLISGGCGVSALVVQLSMIWMLMVAVNGLICDGFDGCVKLLGE